VCSSQVPWIAHLTWKKQLPQHSPLQYKMVVAMGSALVTACWKHFAQAGMGRGACCDQGPWSSSALVPGSMVPYATPWTSSHHNMVLDTIYGRGPTLDVVRSTMFFWSTENRDRFYSIFGRELTPYPDRQNTTTIYTICISLVGAKKSYEYCVEMVLDIWAKCRP
jgi:hypothetical protein